MTLFDVGMLRDYWSVHPPLGHMIEAFLGVKGETSAVASASRYELSTEQAQSQMLELMAAFGGMPGNGGMEVKTTSWEALHAGIGVPMPTFDAAELAARKP